VVSFTPRPLHPQGKSPKFSLNRRVGGPQSQSERGDKGKYPCPCWKSGPGHRAKFSEVKLQNLWNGDWNMTLMIFVAVPSTLQSKSD